MWGKHLLVCRTIKRGSNCKVRGPLRVNNYVRVCHQVVLRICNVEGEDIRMYKFPFAPLYLSSCRPRDEVGWSIVAQTYASAFVEVVFSFGQTEQLPDSIIFKMCSVCLIVTITYRFVLNCKRTLNHARVQLEGCW